MLNGTFGRRERSSLARSKKAGERTRTVNVQLGRLITPDSNELDSQALTNTTAESCTTVCTSEPENGRDDAELDGGSSTPATDQSATGDADPLADLAAVIRGLSSEDRQRLARLLD